MVHFNTKREKPNHQHSFVPVPNSDKEYCWGCKTFRKKRRQKNEA